jgi:hypothetical protein
MPQLSRWFIRTALVYLLASLLTGVAESVVPQGRLILWPTYLHLLVLGWLTQLIFGVAYWMFPRQRAQSSWPSQRLGWICYWCLNLGLILRAVAESGPESWRLSEWMVLSALLQLVGGWAFVVVTWPRVRAR